MSTIPVILFVAPTTFEFNAVREGLDGYLQKGNYRLMMCGMGEEQSSAFCVRLENLPITRLVLIGWGGGLTAELKVGDVICGDKALYAGRPPVPCTLPSGIRTHTGPILTAPNALVTPTEKQAAAACGALAVEMEAYPMATWASQRGIPFVHARLILDAWDESLPDITMDDNGRMRPLELLMTLVKRPAILPELARLNRRVQMLNPLLAKLAIDLVSD